MVACFLAIILGIMGPVRAHYIPRRTALPQSTPRTLIFIAIILLIAGSKSCVAQYKNLDPALAQAAKEYDRAQIEADRSALNRLVADDYLIIRGNGTLGDKKVLLAVVAG